MTTHKDRQLDQKIMKHVQGLMILGNEGMPQYATRKGQQLDPKVNESLLKGWCSRRTRYAPACDNEQTEIQNAPKLLCSKIC